MAIAPTAEITPHLEVSVDPDRPTNMALNEGTYSPAACREVFENFSTREACRRYSSSDNLPLRERIAQEHGVQAENVFLAHGSGPILNELMPMTIKEKILSSPRRVARHLIRKAGYPIITPVPSYSKIAIGAVRKNLTLEFLELRPEDNFELSIPELTRTLERTEGLVYLCNPNNPTGNPLITRAQLEGLLGKFPRSTFWVDEAYIQYMEPDPRYDVADLVRRFDNLIVSRSFSFAYGLAAVRLGYAVTAPRRVAKLEKNHTSYQIGLFQEELGIAALNDEEHLPYVREATARGRAQIFDALDELPNIEVFPSQTHFLLCRFRDGRPVETFIERVRQQGIALRVFEPVGPHNLDHYFRITLGTEAENAALIEAIRRAQIH